MNYNHVSVTLIKVRFHSPEAGLVSRSQTAFFRFSLWWRKKGSGDLTIEFACDKIPSFWGALIADDEPKRGANDLWGDASY